jgi:hypothetical protein
MARFFSAGVADSPWAFFRAERRVERWARLRIAFARDFRWSLTAEAILGKEGTPRAEKVAFSNREG